MLIKFSVKMDSTIPIVQLPSIAVIVNALLVTQLLALMFVIGRVAPAHVQRVTLVDNVMNVKLGTLVIQTAKVCIYYLFLVPVRFQI